jgi:hypothetical protein
MVVPRFNHQSSAQSFDKKDQIVRVRELLRRFDATFNCWPLEGLNLERKSEGPNPAANLRPAARS